MGCSESRLSDKTWENTNKSLKNKEESSISFEQHQFTLYESIEKDDILTISQLLELGFDVNFRMPNFYLRTPLHLACQNGSKKAVELLLNKGADPKIEDSYGISPGFLADLKGNKECVEILKNLENKAKLMPFKSETSAGNHSKESFERRISVF